MNLETLKPTQKFNVFDLVEEAGFDTRDWIESFSKPTGYKANPKYCYEWSFVEPGEVAILNLWWSNMKLEDGLVLQHNNFRKDALENAGHSTWVKRATRLDKAVKRAVDENLIVRVIVNDGRMRERSNPNAAASQVTARELDPEFWTITHYNRETGDNTIVRGIVEPRFLDQHDLAEIGNANPTREPKSGFAFSRDRKVRHSVLDRANGNCEYCGEQGFLMHNGRLYLETHHIVSLSEGGPDTPLNVVALCPNDHKLAHFSRDRIAIRKKLQDIIAIKESLSSPKLD